MTLPKRPLRARTNYRHEIPGNNEITVFVCYRDVSRKRSFYHLTFKDAVYCDANHVDYVAHTWDYTKDLTFQTKNNHMTEVYNDNRIVRKTRGRKNHSRPLSTQ